MNVGNLTAAALCALLGTGGAHAVATTHVALELALVIDVSGSVCSYAGDALACPGLDTSEYQLQLNGYRTAFNDPGVKSAIESFAPTGGVAVDVYFFSQGVIRGLSWQQLSTGEQAAAFGDVIGSIARPKPTATTAINPVTGFEGAPASGPILNTGTNIAGGLQAAAWGLANNGFEGTRRVIDVSGDGIQNSILSGTGNCAQGSVACNAVVDNVRAALPLDIVVNGLAIEGDFGTDGVSTWYDAHVRQGGFVISARGFEDFERAVVLKIGREIAGPVPEPSTLVLFFAGLAGMGWLLRRRRA